MGSDYAEESQKAARIAISKGHDDAENLRELLIWTTAKTTAPMVEEYFSQHRHDASLLAALVAIALEGDDAGDAPWAAANTIADFPAEMLRSHEAELIELSQFDWVYLKLPAEQALSKLRG